MDDTDHEESHAARCRALASRAAVGTLCSIARDPEGYPYGSLVALAFDEQGRPLMLLSQLAEHTGNLTAHAEASILVADPGAGSDPVMSERMTLVGHARRLSGPEAEAARARYLAVHPAAARYADFRDFAMWALDPVRVRYVGGFGRMSWMDGSELQKAG